MRFVWILCWTTLSLPVLKDSPALYGTLYSHRQNCWLFGYSCTLIPLWVEPMSYVEDCISFNSQACTHWQFSVSLKSNPSKIYHSMSYRLNPSFCLCLAIHIFWLVKHLVVQEITVHHCMEQICAILGLQKAWLCDDFLNISKRLYGDVSVGLWLGFYGRSIQEAQW